MLITLLNISYKEIDMFDNENKPEAAIVAGLALVGTWFLLALLGSILTGLVMYLVPAFNLSFQGILIFGSICGTAAFIGILTESKVS